MYHRFVRRKVEALFAAVSRGDAGPVIDGFAPRFEHLFLGEHALGGVRRSREATRAWYDRLFRLLPDIAFELKAIRIAGPPWNTLIAVNWVETNSAGGLRTRTPGVHVARIAWGRMTFLGIYPDTTGLLATLDRLAAAGVTEARAQKIEG